MFATIIMQKAHWLIWMTCIVIFDGGEWETLTHCAKSIKCKSLLT